MLNKHWKTIISRSADPERVRKCLAQLETGPGSTLVANAIPEQGRILAALFSGSAILGELVLSRPELINCPLESGWLASPRQKQGLEHEVNAWLKPCLATGDYQGALGRLRQFRQLEMLRIAARDLAGLGDIGSIILEISNVADVCLSAVLEVCQRRLIEKHGQPWHLTPDGHWVPTPFSVIGLGKLGGQELNYSSDVDVVFVYGDEGSVFKQAPRPSDKEGKGLSNHQYFTRLAEAFIAEISMPASEGQLFRIDLRLRPEGKAGPLVRALESYENFYAQWGQTWERMMLIKARCVAGDEILAHEFLEMVQAFRYPRSIGDRVLKDMAGMKTRIETEVVKANELDRNVKLGRGGIREVEFVAQMLQVLHAGRLPFLQNSQTLPTLEKLVKYQLLPEAEARVLTEAYGFLRQVEHRVQMERNQQTHTIPAEPEALRRLGRLMGFPGQTEFEAALHGHTSRVHAIYQRLFNIDAPGADSDIPDGFEGREKEWLELLHRHSFRDPAKALRLLTEFVEGPGFIHVSPRTEELACELLPKILAKCPQKGQPPSDQPARQQTLSDPDRVLARLDSFVSAYGARATLFETWTTHPSVFELILWLFDRSEFLAEIAIRTPDLVDELVLSGRLRRAKSATDTLADLRHGVNDEDQRLWLRRYHNAEIMRIGLRDILGLADFEQNLAELSALADACIQYAFEVVLRQHKLKLAPFCVVGMGKLGGREIDYGSDLDIIFVAPEKARNLPRQQKMASELMDLLSAPSAEGIVFKTDARLRPDGVKGVLVNTLGAYEEYYRRRAQLWEIQALTRIRAVAGDPATGAKFAQVAASLTNFQSPSLPLTAFTPHWKAEIARMRRRIEKERTPAGKDALAIKTGVGGLVDAEFVAQALCLEHGWQEANSLSALEKARVEGWLAAADAELLIANYGKLRWIEGVLRRWSYEGEILLPDDPAPYYRVSVRCGFDSPEAFRAAVAGYRQAIRQVYLRVFPSEPIAK
jgi:glutamate-ammonia-ligase adenylyltransferase